MSDPEVIYESYGNKLIGAGATGGGSSEQVQADWEQSDTTAPDYIKNKSSITNPEFTEASERVNIASEESIPTLFGKIKKFFTDLKAVAFSGSYNDLSNKPATVVWTNPNGRTDPMVSFSGQDITGLDLTNCDYLKVYFVMNGRNSYVEEAILLPNSY